MKTHLLILLALTVGPAWTTAQQGGTSCPPTGSGLFPITKSWDRFSPEVTSGAFSAADVAVVNSARITPSGLGPGTNCVPWDAASLGLPTTANVDAFSDGTDTLPPLPGLCGPLTIESNWVLTLHSVDRASSGAPGSAIAAEALGNGAASDVYLKFHNTLGFSGPAYPVGDHLAGTPKGSASGPESNVDALGWRDMKRAEEVYFSVDPLTAGTMAGVSPGDILAVTPGGVPHVGMHWFELGLMSPLDDIISLAFDKKAGRIVFSLAPGSPTLAFMGVTSAYMLHWAPPGFSSTPIVWSTPGCLDLAPSDVISAFAAYDPPLGGANNPQPNPNPNAYSDPPLLGTSLTGLFANVLRVDGGFGSVDRRTQVGVSEAFSLEIRQLPPGAPYMLDHWGLFSWVGTPTDPEVWSPSATTSMAFQPCLLPYLFSPFVTGPTATLVATSFNQAVLPCLGPVLSGATLPPWSAVLTAPPTPATVTLQAVALRSTASFPLDELDLFITNAIILEIVDAAALP